MGTTTTEPQAEAREGDDACRIEILVETGTYEGAWNYAALAEAAGPDLEASALCAARTLWDEAYSGVQGCARRLTLTTYGPNFPDGHSLRMQSRP